MYNYAITRISCWAVCRYFFAAGSCLGGTGGLLLGLMERQLISVLGGLFIGLLAGIAFAVTGLVLAATFNALAPLTGGLAIQLEALPATTTSKSGSMALPAPAQQSLFPGE